MASMDLIASFDDTPPTPWANGAGETTELVSLDASSRLTPDRRRWRLSIARLERPGPFSALPGLDRTFAPTAEVVLTIDGTAHPAGPGRPLRFSGDADVVLTELREPCFAINLMVERDGDRPGVTMTPTPAEPPRFALALEPGPRWGRFALLEVEGSEDLPDHLGVIGLS